jgi:hypothetical protein
MFKSLTQWVILGLILRMPIRNMARSHVGGDQNDEEHLRGFKT